MCAGTLFMVYGLWFIGKETSVAVFIAFTPYTLNSKLLNS